MCTIQYSNLAVQDLSELFELIFEDKPTVAVEYITKLENYIELLQENPKMRIECKTKNIHKECRILIYENYLIFYTFKDQKDQIVTIIRILSRLQR
jgi:plasmid stabilization system protein ParE